MGLARVEVAAEELPGVDRHRLRGEALADLAVLLEQRVDVERIAGLDAEDLLGEPPLLGDHVLEPFPEHRRIQQVPDADPAPTDLVLVGRADAAAGRARVEIRVGLCLLLDPVEHPMVRHNHVCAPGHAHVRFHLAVAQPVDLLEERPRVHHTPVAEDAGRPADGPARNQRQFVLVAALDDGVARVVAALIPGDDVCAASPQVDQGALALVAQLGADDRHSHTRRFSAPRKTHYGPPREKRPTGTRSD